MRFSNAFISGAIRHFSDFIPNLDDSPTQAHDIIVQLLYNYCKGNSQMNQNGASHSGGGVPLGPDSLVSFFERRSHMIIRENVFAVRYLENQTRFSFAVHFSHEKRPFTKTGLGQIIYPVLFISRGGTQERERGLLF